MDTALLCFASKRKPNKKQLSSQVAIRLSHASITNRLYHKTASQVQCELAVKPRDPGRSLQNTNKKHLKRRRAAAGIVS